MKQHNPQNPNCPKYGLQPDTDAWYSRTCTCSDVKEKCNALIQATVMGNITCSNDKPCMLHTEKEKCTCQYEENHSPECPLYKEEEFEPKESAYSMEMLCFKCEKPIEEGQTFESDKWRKYHPYCKFLTEPSSENEEWEDLFENTFCKDSTTLDIYFADDPGIYKLKDFIAEQIRLAESRGRETMIMGTEEMQNLIEKARQALIQEWLAMLEEKVESRFGNLDFQISCDYWITVLKTRYLK